MGNQAVGTFLGIVGAVVVLLIAAAFVKSEQNDEAYKACVHRECDIRATAAVMDVQACYDQQDANPDTMTSMDCRR